MNYFELFELPVNLKPEKVHVKKKFYELSRQYHPDFFTNEDEEAQAEALEKSSLVNKAFKTFQNEDETIKYVLQIKGLLEEEEKFQLPNDFLMEMMDLNESVMDAEIEGNAGQMAAVEGQIEQFKNEIYEPVQQIVEDYKEGVTTEKELLQVKTYYYKKKYLNRILAGLR